METRRYGIGVIGVDDKGGVLTFVTLSTESYRGAVSESWKAEGDGNVCRRELDAWQWNDWRA